MTAQGHKQNQTELLQIRLRLTQCCPKFSPIRKFFKGLFTIILHAVRIVHSFPQFTETPPPLLRDDVVLLLGLSQGPPNPNPRAQENQIYLTQSPLL